MTQVEMAKKPVNLTADPALLKEARALGLNLSEIFEKGVAEAVAERRRERWIADNKDALEAHNRYMERHGLFGDGKRLF